MLIVVIGNYLSNNLGDDMYLFLLRKRYPKHEFVAHSLLADRRPSFIIYGGGGILRNDCGRRQLLSEWIKKFKAPYCVLSVGTAEIETIEFDDESFPEAEFITVRDRASADAISSAEYLPDLAWAFKPKSIEHLGEGLEMGIMLRHSIAFNSFTLVERARAEMATWDESWYRFFSTYGERLGDKTLAYVTGAGFPSKYIPYSGVKPDEYLENYRYVKRVVAMPLHGIIFAAIYGVPWAGWSYSSKVTWQVEEMEGTIGLLLDSDLVWNETRPDVVARLRDGAMRHFELLDTRLA